jgi:hypothetical protein
MFAAGTVVAAGTQAVAAVTGMRARYLRQALEELLAQLSPPHIRPAEARELALFLVRHPWLRGTGGSPAAYLRREDFVRLLLDAAAQDSAAAARLRDAFGWSCACDAARVSQSLGSHALRLALQSPDDSPHRRHTRATIEALGPHPLLALIDAWYPRAMERATHRFMRHTRVLTALFAVALVVSARLDLLEFFRVRQASHWPGMALSWLLISLGTPFWYDRVKDLLHLRQAG